MTKNQTNRPKKIFSVIPSSRLLAIVFFALMLVIAFYIGMNYANSKTIVNNKQSILPVNMNSTIRSELKCAVNGLQSRTEYFEKYKVIKDENLLSISRYKLGDPSRVNEIIKLNQHFYPSLSFENPFIEVGWVLLLPSSDIKKSSGALSVMAGEVIRQDGQIYWLRTREVNSEDGDFPIYTNTATVYKNINLEIGKCVIVIYDTNSAYGGGPQAVVVYSQN